MQVNNFVSGKTLTMNVKDALISFLLNEQVNLKTKVKEQLYCAPSATVLLRISCGCTSCQGHDRLHGDSIGHITRCSVQVHANEGLSGCIGGRTLECPSLCLTCLRDVLKTPCRTREKGGKKCVITEEKKLCEWQASERHKDIAFPCWHSLSGRKLTAKAMANPVVLSQGVDFKALVTLTSPLLHITLNPHLCLLSEFTSILCQARYFQFAPVLCGLEELQGPGCEP